MRDKTADFEKETKLPILKGAKSSTLNFDNERKLPNSKWDNPPISRNTGSQFFLSLQNEIVQDK